MKKKLVSMLLCVAMTAVMVAGCSSEGAKETASEDTNTESADSGSNKGSDNDKLVVGFAQIGQESGWRDAETASIQFHYGQNLDTIDLKFADAQQKQENQIKAIKSFIDMGVDVIGVAPVKETGWEAVFQEAKDAGIPIVLVDRRVDEEIDEDLYATFIGSDFIEEGKNAAIEMAELIGGSGKVVELEGSAGASAANDRKKGFHDEIEANWPDIEIVASQDGDFTRANGKQVMESFLKSYPDGIDGVYAHNDDMMLGAIEAIKEAGKKPAEDIKTVSIDGVGDIFEAMVAGEANVTVECNPLLGPLFFEVCQKLKDGEEVDDWYKSEEDIFRQADAKAALPDRKY